MASHVSRKQSDELYDEIYPGQNGTIYGPDNVPIGAAGKAKFFELLDYITRKKRDDGDQLIIDIRYALNEGRRIRELNEAGRTSAYAIIKPSRPVIRLHYNQSLQWDFEPRDAWERERIEQQENRENAQT